MSQDDAKNTEFSETDAQRRDSLLLKLLKTPPIQRAKRERAPKESSESVAKNDTER